MCYYKQTINLIEVDKFLEYWYIVRMKVNKEVSNMCDKCASYFEGFLKGLNMDPNSDCTKALIEASKCISAMASEINDLRGSLDHSLDRIDDLQDLVDDLNSRLDECCCDSDYSKDPSSYSCDECGSNCSCDGDCSDSCDCGCN